MKFQVESQSSISSSSRRKLSVKSPPSSLQDWLDEELERRGIDAVIYTRYILSILLQDSYDVDTCKHNAIDEDICSYYFCNDRKLKNCSNHIRSNCRKNTESIICGQYHASDHEQRKKSAVVECLMSISEEKYGIEELVEDLCAKLKEFQLEHNVNENEKSQPLKKEVKNDYSSIEEQAKKYYAAFPALSGPSTDPLIKLSITKKKPEMVIEKSAWMPGHQLSFDCQISPVPVEDKDELNEEVLKVDGLTESERDSMPNSNSTQNKPPSFIVPKVNSAKSNQLNFSSNFMKKDPPFHVKHTFKEDNKSDSLLILSSTSEQRNDATKSKHDVNEDGDDEILAKFIEKFNDDNMAAIWDKMLQPSFIDSVLYKWPKFWDPSLILNSGSEENFLSIWSAAGSCNASYFALDEFNQDRRKKNIYFEANLKAKDLGEADDLSIQPTISVESCSLISSSPSFLSLANEYHTSPSLFLRGSQDEGTGKNEDDLKFCNNSDMDKDVSLFQDIKSSNYSFQKELPHLSYNHNAESNYDCLLTSDRTHFRPIQQDSIDDDKDITVQTIVENASPLKDDLEFFTPSLDIHDKDFSADLEDECESRDSWSPDMKDCYPSSPQWASYPISVTSNSSTGDICQVSEFSALSPNPLNDFDAESNVSFSNNVDKIDKEDNEELLPSTNPQSWQKDSVAWNGSYSLDESSKTDIKYVSWSSQKKVWSNDESKLDFSKFGNPLETSKTSWNIDCKTWSCKSSEDDAENRNLVEALRVEIKEETKQLFDDIQDMITKDEDHVVNEDVAHEIKDEALFEWMKNVNLENSSFPKPLSPLEPSIFDEALNSNDIQLSPNEIIYSSELEAEWMKDGPDYNIQTPRLKDKFSSKSYRRPCSFFMEGNCRRSDCKFSHDLSNITCRFWEEHCCFKGITCPFLHGYPLSSEESDPDTSNSSSIKLDHESDFPVLPHLASNNSTDDQGDKKCKGKKSVKIKNKKKKKSNQSQQVKNT